MARKMPELVEGVTQIEGAWKQPDWAQQRLLVMSGGVEALLARDKAPGRQSVVRGAVADEFVE